MSWRYNIFTGTLDITGSGSSSGAVDSISNSDGSITVSAPIGDVVVSLDATLKLHLINAYDEVVGIQGTTGILVYDGAGGHFGRTVTGTANQITVANGNGVSGNPTLSIPSSPTLPGTTTVAQLIDSGLTANTPIYSNASKQITSATALTNGQVLLGSTSAAPVSATIGIGTSGTDAAWAVGAGTLTLNIPDASATARGLVTTGTQTFEGSKNYNGQQRDYQIATFEGGLISYADIILGIGTAFTGVLNFGHASHAFTTTFQNSASQSANAAYTWPVDDGTANQVLKTDGSGVLSWATVAGTGDVVGPSSSVDNTIVRFDGTTGKLIQGYTSGGPTISDTGAITATQGGSLTGTWSNLGTVTTIDINGGTLDGTVIGGASAAAATVTTLVVNTSALPDAEDGAPLGAAGTAWSDLFLAEGGVINWDSGDATLTQAGNIVTLAGAVFAADIGSSTATTQASNDNSTKVATTAYVDNAILSTNYKEAVKYGSVAALPAIVYANGSSGVGATLTGVALAAISLDGASPGVADRVLIKNQVSDFQNGIYVVTQTGSGAAVFILTRAIDFDQAADIKTGDTTFVTAGNTLANTLWAYTGIDSPTMGTTALTFVQVSADLIVGQSVILSGTTTRILYDNAGVLGEYTLTGSGTVVAMQTAPTFATSITGSYLTASEILITDGSKNIVSAAVATYPSLTELTYVKGLTSAAQTQITARALTATTITIAGTANQITSSAGAQDLSANRTWTLSFPADVLIPTVLTVPNTGLHILDTNASHDLIIKPGSNITADRTLTITTGDTDMIVDLTAVTDEYILAYDTGTNTWRGVVNTGGIPTQITVANEATDATSFIAFFTAATGDLGPKTNTNMTFDSSTGIATFASTVLTTTDINGGTVDGAVIGGSSAAAGTFTLATAEGFAPTATTATGNRMYLPAANTLGWAINGTGEMQLTATALSPIADGGNSLGTTALGWQNLFGNTGFVFNIENGDWVATHTAGILTVGTGDLRVTTAGTNAASAVTVGGTQTLTAKTLTSPAINTGTIGTSLVPTSNDGAPLGNTTNQFSDLFLAEGGVINWDNGDATLTQTGDVLAIAGADFRIATAGVGTNADSVPTISSTSTLTNKTLTSPTLTTPSAFTTGGAITLAENTSIALDPAGSADGKYSGITVTAISGYTQAFGDLVTLDKDDSRWEAVDISVAAAATGDARGIMGMVVVTGTDGNACTILLHGIIRADANFPALTIGAAVYASTTGDIVVAQPTTTDHVIRIIGSALTADEIYFNPDNAWITHT